MLGIPDWFEWGAVCFAHPLRFDRDVADKYVRRAREGVPAGLTAMPVAGCSTPVTVEGFTVASSAEHVAGWIVARAVNPGVRLMGSTWAGTLDMKTGTVSYSAFDARYFAFASVSFLRRWTGVEVQVGGGEYCAATEPGLYAAYEKAYKAMMIAAFTGRHPSTGAGLLDDGKVISPVQLMIERDLADGIGLLGRELAPSPERIGMDAIEEVGLGLETNHMLTEHAHDHFRSSLWLPELIDRSGWCGASDDAALLGRAQDCIDELVATYRKPPGREDQLQRLRLIVDGARGVLAG